jgi:hypothetical protein
MRGLELAAYGDQSLMRSHAGLAYAEAAATRAAFAQLAWSQPMVIPAAYTPDSSSVPVGYGIPPSPHSWHGSHHPHHPHPHQRNPHHHPRYRSHTEWEYSLHHASHHQSGIPYGSSYRANLAYAPDQYAGGDFGRYDGVYGGTYNNPQCADTSHAATNARIVAQIAQRMGFNREQTIACIATMLVESRGDEQRPGDFGHGRYHSYGLFQLNDAGEGEGLSIAQRCDPALNATMALNEFRRHRYEGDPGWWAANAQRPKDWDQLAQRVNAMMPAAARLLRASDNVYV